MQLGHSSILRLRKRQTFPTPRRPFYSFLYYVISVSFPCNLHRGSFSLRSEPWICKVLYAGVVLTTYMCSLIWENRPLTSISKLPSSRPFNSKNFNHSTDSSFLDLVRNSRSQYVSYPLFKIDLSSHPSIGVDPTSFPKLRS